MTLLRMRHPRSSCSSLSRLGALCGARTQTWWRQWWRARGGGAHARSAWHCDAHGDKHTHAHTHTHARAHTHTRVHTCGGTTTTLFRHAHARSHGARCEGGGSSSSPWCGPTPRRVGIIGWWPLSSSSWCGGGRDRPTHRPTDRPTRRSPSPGHTMTHHGTPWHTMTPNDTPTDRPTDRPAGRHHLDTP